MKLGLAAAVIALIVLSWYARALHMTVSSQAEQIRSLTAESAAKAQQGVLAMQTECAAAANRFLTIRGWKAAADSTFENHFNARLNRCFVLVSDYDLSQDFRTIEVYDAIGGRRYASYNGHNVCDTNVTRNPKKCALDSGAIWFDGNDAKSPADLVVGFRGLLNGGGTGNEDTQRTFIEKVHEFMNR